MNAEIGTCPHCNGELTKWTPPDDSTWGTGFQLVCFNNECPYYVRGWQWMKDQFQQRASYRYRYNPQTGEDGPLPVWSENALKDGITEDKEKE